MDPQEILDRTETCQKLGISRQTLLSWIRKGKLKVWKRVGSGSNSALLFARAEVESLLGNGNGNGHGNGHVSFSAESANGNGHSAEPTAA